MKKIGKIVLFLVVGLVFCLTFNNEAFAEEPATLRVSGYAPPRNRYGLAKPDGSPPTQLPMESFGLYSALIDPMNFGESGIVKCTIQYKPFFNYVANTSLVNSDGDRFYDVFFAGLIETSLTDEEATELAMFVNAGGLLYISGENNTPNSGSAYNLLFEKLGINDRFDTVGVNPDGSLSISLAPENSTVITNGPFTPVSSFRHDSYKIFNYLDTTPIVRTISNDVIVAERAFGAGYLSITGSTIYRDRFLSGTNKNYFLNLFALGCNREPIRVLDVPSLKQGIPPYDGVNPFWENDEYDDAQKVPLQSMWCGRNMAQCGCALTSATMVMKYFGVNVDPLGKNIDPPTVNDYFKVGTKKLSTKDANGQPYHYYRSFGFNHGDFLFEMVDEFTQRAHLANQGSADQQRLDQYDRENFDSTKLKEYIDQDVPVILKVTRLGGGVHFVVVKGYRGNDFIINDPAVPDPGAGEYTTLASQNYTPYPRLAMISYQKANTDFSGLLLVSPFTTRLMVTDSLGRKTGYDSTTNNLIEEIPDSIYFFEEVYVDPTGGVPVAGGEAGIWKLLIKTPVGGNYKIEAIGKNSSYTFSIFATDVDGDTVINDFYDNKNAVGLFTFKYTPDSQGAPFSQLVGVDVRPFVKSNVIYIKSKMAIPVALLQSQNFDVKSIDTASLTFGKSGDENSISYCSKQLLDVNSDRNKDLVCYVDGRKTGLTQGIREAILKGQTTGGLSIQGSDMVNVINL